MSEGDFKGEIFNIGNGKNHSINEVAKMFGGKTTQGNQILEPFQTLADNSKAKLILKWDPKGDLSKWINKNKKQWNI